MTGFELSKVTVHDPSGAHPAEPGQVKNAVVCTANVADEPRGKRMRQSKDPPT